MRAYCLMASVIFDQLVKADGLETIYIDACIEDLLRLRDIRPIVCICICVYVAMYHISPCNVGPRHHWKVAERHLLCSCGNEIKVTNT